MNKLDHLTHNSINAYVTQRFAGGKRWGCAFEIFFLVSFLTIFRQCGGWQVSLAKA